MSIVTKPVDQEPETPVVAKVGKKAKPNAAAKAPEVKLEDLPQSDPKATDEPVVNSTPVVIDYNDPTISGASKYYEPAQGLASTLTIPARLELAIIDHMNTWGKEVTSKELHSIADEMLN